MLSRAGMFRVTEGLGVDMKDRVYELHSFHSKSVYFSILSCISFVATSLPSVFESMCMATLILFPLVFQMCLRVKYFFKTCQALLLLML